MDAFSDNLFLSDNFSFSEMSDLESPSDMYWVMPDFTLHWQKLLMTTWGCAVWVVVSYILYRKKIFIAL